MYLLCLKLYMTSQRWRVFWFFFFFFFFLGGGALISSVFSLVFGVVYWSRPPRVLRRFTALLLLHVITHNCSEMHRIVGIPIIAHSSLQPWTFVNRVRCLRVYDSLRGSEINIIDRVCLDNRDKFSISMGNIGKATEPCISTTNTSDWHLLDSPLYSLYRFMYRQHVYALEKRRGDCLMKWFMLGFMDLRGPRVCRRSTPVLSHLFCCFVTPTDTLRLVHLSLLQVVKRLSKESQSMAHSCSWISLHEKVWRLLAQVATKFPVSKCSSLKISSYEPVSTKVRWMKIY